MASRAKVHHKRASMTLPMAVILGFYPLANQGLAGFQAGGLKGAAKQMTLALTGFNADDSKFYFEWLKAGLVPILAGAGVHWAANKFGINRALARSGIPLLRI